MSRGNMWLNVRNIIYFVVIVHIFAVLQAGKKNMAALPRSMNWT